MFANLPEESTPFQDLISFRAHSTLCQIFSSCPQQWDPHLSQSISHLANTAPKSRQVEDAPRSPPWARLQAPFIRVFYPHHNRGRLVLDPHFANEETGSEGLGKLLDASWRESGKARTHTQVCLMTKPGLCLHPWSSKPRSACQPPSSDAILHPNPGPSRLRQRQ